MVIMAQQYSLRNVFTFVIAITSLALTSQADGDAEVISSPNVVSLTKPFSDIEDFSRINSWTYKGLSWSGKVKSGNQFNLTDPPSDDKDVILSFTKSKPSTLIKDFTLNGPLTKANFTMKYYIRILDPAFNIKGLLFDSNNKSKEHVLFDMDHDDLASENNTWVTRTATHESDLVPDIFTSNPFTIKLEFSSTSMIYDDDIPQYQFVVVDELSLTGSEIITSLPQVGGNTTRAPVKTDPPTTLPVTTAIPGVNISTHAPSVNKTTVPSVNNETVSNISTHAPSVNKTSVPSVNNETVSNISTHAPIVNKTTVPPVNNETDASGHTHDGGLKEEVEKVAKAIWDAFYVFLALFCACLVALIILIYKARNSRDDAPPPAVATYNPRTASYRLDSTGSSQYDNPAYRNEAV